MTPSDGRESSEAQLTESPELGPNTFEHLAEAAARCIRFAEHGWSK